MKHLVRSGPESEQGFALVTVMILMLVGSVVLASLLRFMGTGITTTTTYTDKSKQLYAADAGIKDGEWAIRKDQLTTMFPGPVPVEYAPYDYSASSGHSWQYPLAQPVNTYGVNVTISNVWMPKDLAAPDPATAQTVIEGTANNPPQLVVTSLHAESRLFGSPARAFHVEHGRVQPV